YPLCALAGEVWGIDVVARATQRCQLALRDMLATAADRRFTDLANVSFVVSTAVVGPVEALLAAQAPPRRIAAVRAQLKTMVAAYLREVASLPAEEPSG
ncbi:hypothetical protein OOT46_19865, partial [Aquabacterium sp. A7-Y]|uniref:hypothetical protein n=1 Tax=Aquabacterium sp. A7-Y TaxID=1349605 RepID=UPI00223CF7BA